MTGPARPAGAGREAQRRRTRRAIVDATQRLLTESAPAPSIDAIAAAADVSRRTIYLHFPTLDQLLLDAALGALSSAYVDTAMESAASTAHLVQAFGDDVQARVAALVAALVDLGETTLPLGRKIMRLTVDADSDRHGGAEEPIRARRGARRIGWIEAAIAPVVPALTDEQHQRLVSGLSLVLGFESMIVLQDVCGLDRAAEKQTSLWAARALVSAVLTEVAEAASPGTRGHESDTV